MIELIERLPKAELHLHIEGSLEPKLMFELAKKNNVTIPYATVEEVQEAYDFTYLQSFLDIYYAGVKVLITQDDFYDLTWAYVLKATLSESLFYLRSSSTSKGNTSPAFAVSVISTTVFGVGSVLISIILAPFCLANCAKPAAG